MRLSTRLLLPLLAAVTLVMSAYAFWALQQRKETLVREARRETRAYSVALGIALEGAFRDPDRPHVQSIIDRISREPQIYGIFVYGPDGRVLFASDPLRGANPAAPATLRRVVETGRGVSFHREIAGEQVYSLLRAIRGPGGEVAGAFEVAQPLAALRSARKQIHQRFLLNTLTLLAAVAVLLHWLVRYRVATPLARFVSAARALGRGELAHRIDEATGVAELDELARELNRMAGRLEAARSDLVREAEERVALERRLRHTEQLAALGKLAGSLAHEVAAPLNVVSGRAEMLLRTPSMPPPAQERNLRIIRDQIHRITVIVRNLLDFTRRRDPRPRPVELGALLDGVGEFLGGEFDRAGIRFAREGAASRWVHGDPHLLHQVLLNLLLNAAHALESVEGEKRVVARILEDAEGPEGGVVLEVEDSGPGIPAEALPHLFEPFYTTKPEGTGLGLAVARGIVEEAGGRIEARNGAGGGAVFRVVLPAASAPEALHA